MKKVILASGSPRRLELLRQVGIEPVVEPSQVEEAVTSKVPAQVVMELSRQKAEDIGAAYMGEKVFVIGADTVVAIDGEILGKPSDRGDAVDMLLQLQGRTHQVYTGVTIISCEEKNKITTFFEVTEVKVCPMTMEEILWYVNTGEPMDKAGAYGIQGYFAAFIEGIHGDYNNVVGLPIGRVWRELQRSQDTL